MRYNIYSIRDRAADVFAQPFFLPSHGVANRVFADEINRVDANNNLNKHPEDFDLYFLGTFDDNEGSFEAQRPQQMAVGKDVVR